MLLDEFYKSVRELFNNADMVLHYDKVIAVIVKEDNQAYIDGIPTKENYNGRFLITMTEKIRLNARYVLFGLDYLLWAVIFVVYTYVLYIFGGSELNVYVNNILNISVF